MRYSQVKQPVATIAGVNNELEKIANSIDDMVSRKAGDGPNTLDATLDANSQRIINLPEPVTNTEPVRKADFDDLGNNLRSDVYTAVRNAEDATDDAIAAANTANSAANNANSAADNANIAADNAYQAIADLESDGYAVIDQIESDGESAIQALRVVNAGSFEDGATLTARNEVLYSLTEQTYYRWDGALPKTVPPASTPAGTGGVGVGAWVDVGDAALRSELSDPDKGAVMVARGVVAVDSIADLLALPEGQRKEGLRYLVKGYYADKDLGGGQFYWDASRDKSEANGGTILDPDSIGSFDGTASTLPDLLTTQGQASGGGVWVKVTNGSYSPYEFGYAGTYESGMWSCSQIIEMCKNLGGGTLSMPAERFYLGGQPQYGYFKGLSYVEAGDNLTWHVPAGAVVELMGTFGVVWRPIGFGYEGGRKNFHMYGGGKFEGASRDPSDWCFLTLNAAHVTNFTCEDVIFKEVAAGHIFDLMGVKNVTLENLEFIGSCLDFQGDRAGAEYIQIDYTSSGSRRYQIPEDNQWMDLLPCSNLKFKNLSFRANTDDAGNILSYPQISLGAHAFACANVDSLIIKDIYIEQTDPNAVSNRLNTVAVVLPACDYLEVDGITYKTFSERTDPSAALTTEGFVCYVYNAEQQVVSEPSGVPTEVPSYVSVPRTAPTGKTYFRNLVAQMDHPLQSDGFVGRVLVSAVSCTVEGLEFYGNPDATSRQGYDLFILGRGGFVGFGGTYVEESPVFKVSNIKAYGNFKNFIFSPERGRFVFKDVYAEGNEFSFRDMEDYTKIELLKMDNFTLRSKSVTGQSTSAFYCARLEITNSSLDTLGLRALQPDTTGYVLNNVLPSGLDTTWTSNPNIQFDGNVLIAP